MHHLLDITQSVAYHGFKKIILLNGHGSNYPPRRAGRPADQPGDGRRVLHPLLVATGRRLLEPARSATSPPRRLRPRLRAGDVDVPLPRRRRRPHRPRARRAAGVRHRDPGGSEWQWVDLTAGAGPATIVEWTLDLRRPARSARPSRRPPRRARSSSSMRSAASSTWSLAQGSRRRRASRPPRDAADLPPAVRVLRTDHEDHRHRTDRVAPRPGRYDTGRRGHRTRFSSGVHTDEGIVGIGEGADASPYLARMIVEMPSSHSIARGLREVLVGKNRSRSTASGS